MPIAYRFGSTSRKQGLGGSIPPLGVYQIALVGHEFTDETDQFAPQSKLMFKVIAPAETPVEDGTLIPTEGKGFNIFLTYGSRKGVSDDDAVKSRERNDGKLMAALEGLGFFSAEDIERMKEGNEEGVSDEELPAFDEMFQAAADNAAADINNANTGYVVFEPASDYKAKTAEGFKADEAYDNVYFIDDVKYQTALDKGIRAIYTPRAARAAAKKPAAGPASGKATVTQGSGLAGKAGQKGALLGKSGSGGGGTTDGAKSTGTGAKASPLGGLLKGKAKA